MPSPRSSDAEFVSETMGCNRDGALEVSVWLGWVSASASGEQEEALGKTTVVEVAGAVVIVGWVSCSTSISVMAHVGATRRCKTRRRGWEIMARSGRETRQRDGDRLIGRKGSERRRDAA